MYKLNLTERQFLALARQVQSSCKLGGTMFFTDDEFLTIEEMKDMNYRFYTALIPPSNETEITVETKP